MPRKTLVDKGFDPKAFRKKRLSVNKLSKTFGTKRVLNNVSFSVNPGEIFVITGPSGSGKSTLLKLLCRLLEPDHGEIWLGNLNLLHIDTLVVRRLLCYVPQVPIMFEGTVRDNLLLAPKVLGIKVSENLLKTTIRDVGLDSSYLDKIAEKLSVGEKQRVALARALLINPAYLLLDEPTSHLDPDNTKLLEDLIIYLRKEKNVNFIVVSHDMSQANRIGTRIGRLDINGLTLVKGA